MTEGLLAADDRLLVLGGGGWFGQTLLHMVGSSAPIHATASSARPGLQIWNLARIRDFGPTVVANFAFLTRERIASEGVEEFTRANESLTQRFLEAISLPTVRAALTVSSGAAVTDPNEPYGRLKLAEETSALSCVSSSLAVVAARAYSVSGPFVRRPQDYAFSEMVIQASEGYIQIRSPEPTFRRYVSVSDLLSVTLGTALSGRSGVIDSGGDLVEMADLAAHIVARVNPTAVVSRVPMTSEEPSIYASDNATWQFAVSARRFSPMGLDAQIDAVVQSLASCRR